MSQIRSSNTKPERLVRSVIHRLGFRFRLCTGATLRGKPDIVLPKYRTVVFVHGCFWHRHKKCKLAYTPKSRIEFWTKKFTANVQRDRVVRRQLRNEGWRVIEIWECETRNCEALSRKIARLLHNNGDEEGKNK